MHRKFVKYEDYIEGQLGKPVWYAVEVSYRAWPITANIDFQGIEALLRWLATKGGPDPRPKNERYTIL